MNLLDGLDIATVLTIPSMVVITYLAGTILRDQFGWNAKKVGFITALLLSILVVITQLVPSTGGPIKTIVVALGGGLIVYSLAFMSSDVISKLNEILNRGKVDQGEEEGPAVVEAPEGTIASATYYGPPSPGRWRRW